MMKTWREIIALTARYLAKRQVPEAEIAAELLVARLLRCGRGMLAPHLEREVPEKYLEAMRRAMARLVAGEPIQYVLGEWDFRTLTLKCDRRGLIPRPETEELVSRALKYLQGRFADAKRLPFVVDVCTGSGCIALSLAKEFPDAIYLGIDLSAEAVALAQENAELCGLSSRVRFAVADGLDDFDEPQSVDMIISNPPYIPTAECMRLDRRIRDFEPMMALDGGETGLLFYERFAADAVNLLKPGGAVFFEIGDRQGEAVGALLHEFGFNNIKIESDYAGHDRYASGVLD